MSKKPYDDTLWIVLSPAEQEWVHLQPFLLKRGYRLPPRYHPNWKPAWRKKRLWGSKHPWDYPDSETFYNPKLSDAVRLSDRKKVVLKRVNPRRDIPILEYLHSPELAKDPRNNTVPLLDVIYLPDRDDVAIIVMPMLYLFENHMVPFEYVSEVLETLDQFLKGLEFLHEHQIAHRDACLLNLMMDPTKVLPGGFHFAEPTCKPGGKGPVKPRSRRSVGPIKYYFVDYELALYYPGNEHDSYGKFGQDKTVPEFADKYALYDPFKLDVYQMGGVISYLVDRYGLCFLYDLEAQMRCRDPAKRPTAAEAYQKFSDIVKSLSLEETTRKITRTPEEFGVSHLRGPEKYEKATNPQVQTDPTRQHDCVVSSDSDCHHDLPDLTSADVLDSSSAQVAEAIVILHAPDSPETDATEPVVDSRPTYGNSDEPDHCKSTLNASYSFDTSFESASGLHSDIVSRSIHTTQSIDTVPTSIGSTQSLHLEETPRIVDITTKPEESSPPAELLSPCIPPPTTAARLATPKTTTSGRPRWWRLGFLFTNIKRSFRS